MEEYGICLPSFCAKFSFFCYCEISIFFPVKCVQSLLFFCGGCFIEIYAARAGSITSRAGSVINGEVQVISGALIIS